VRITGLALVTVSFVIGIGSSATGAVEKVVLSALIVGSIVVAAQVSKFATRTRERLQRR
jgi:aspartate aminotransferase-like enzyme